MKVAGVGTFPVPPRWLLLRIKTDKGSTGRPFHDRVRGRRPGRQGPRGQRAWPRPDGRGSESPTRRPRARSRRSPSTSCRPPSTGPGSSRTADGPPLSPTSIHRPRSQRCERSGTCQDRLRRTLWTAVSQETREHEFAAAPDRPALPAAAEIRQSRATHPDSSFPDETCHTGPSSSATETELRRAPSPCPPYRPVAREAGTPIG